MIRKLAIAGVMVVAATTAALADVGDNKVTAAAALQALIGDHDVAAVDQYLAEPYIQHNPRISSGVEPIRGLVAHLAEGPKFEVDIHRVLGDGDLVALHVTYTGLAPEPLVAFDVFRFNDEGKIVEHWDNLTPVTSPNPSGRTQTDGATNITDLDKTEANRATVETFINDFLIAHSATDVTQFISPKTYIQHNSNVADGLEGFGAAVAAMAEKGLSFNYEKLHFTVAEGNFVLAASNGSIGDDKLAFYDLFRLEDGLIVEHWDVVAPMPGEDVAEGFPGKF